MTPHLVHLRVLVRGSDTVDLYICYFCAISQLSEREQPIIAN